MIAEAAREMLHALRCIACGATVAACLAECGSLHCHDCRDRVAVDRIVRPSDLDR